MFPLTKSIVPYHFPSAATCVRSFDLPYVPSRPDPVAEPRRTFFNRTLSSPHSLPLPVNLVPFFFLEEKRCPLASFPYPPSSHPTFSFNPLVIHIHHHPSSPPSPPPGSQRHQWPPFPSIDPSSRFRVLKVRIFFTKRASSQPSAFWQFSPPPPPVPDCSPRFIEKEDRCLLSPRSRRLRSPAVLSLFWRHSRQTPHPKTSRLSSPLSC